MSERALEELPPAGAEDHVLYWPIGRLMEREHEDAGAHLREIRRLTADYTAPADGDTTYRVCFDELAQFERNLHRHIHLADMCCSRGP